MPAALRMFGIEFERLIDPDQGLFGFFGEAGAPKPAERFLGVQVVDFGEKHPGARTITLARGGNRLSQQMLG